MKKTKNHNGRHVILALLSVLLLLVLVFFGSQNFIQKKLNSNASHVPTLNMAIVNEDNGTIYRGKKYLLAKDYLNGLKLPKKVSMDVVPRGVAESGLKNNNYQLAVFIPTDFSAKIVEVDNPDPQKLDIQYRINAKNQAMKSRCHNEADDIIQGLNKKLVSIYDLGIMSNLFDAQNKVAGIYARQGVLAADYRNGLAGPISNLSQGFPDLQDGTKSLLSESQAYQKAQKQANQAQALAAAKQAKNTQDDLTKIMQQQAKNNQNKAELAKQALQTSSKIDDQIPQEIGDLNIQNKQLSQGIGTSKSDAADQLQKDFETYSQGYEDEINTVRKALQSTNGQLDPSTVKNTVDHQNSSSSISENSSSKSQTSNGSSQSVTFGKYLQKKDPDLYKELSNLNNIDDLNDLYQQLPFNAKLSTEAKATLTNQEYQEIKKDIVSIKDSNQQLTSAGLKPEFNGNSNEVSEFNGLYKQVHKDQKDDQTKLQTQQIVLSRLNNVDQDQFEITVPNKVKLTNANAQQINPNKYKLTVGKSSKLTLDLTFKPVDLKGEDSTVKVDYLHRQAEPKKVTITNQTNQQQITQVVQPVKDNKSGDQQNASQVSQASKAEPDDNQQPAATSSIKTSNQTQTTTSEVNNDQEREFAISFNLASVNDQKLTSNSKLDRMMGKWVAEYDDAAKMAASRANLLKDRPIQTLMNEKLSDVLSGLVKQANDQNKQNSADLLATLDQDSKKLAQEKANYEKELASIGNDSKQALQNAQDQLQKLQQVQNEMNQNAKKAANSDNSNDSDSMSGLANLSDQASDTNADVAQDDGTYDGIYQELTSLNNSLGSIQNSGKSLNGKSMNLQKAFRNELAKSGDFAQSFINVLNAAYKNGVPNQKLLNFITNPVGGVGNEVVSERTQSYNMGMWTIVLTILALFIAYAVENMKYFQSGKYFSKKQTKLNIHTRKLIFLGIASLLSGIILAPIAAKQFPIIDSNRLLWSLSFVFLSMTLTLIFYVLMHYAKIWGTGLIIASLLNYVFNQTQFLKNVILQHLNVLGLVGNQLLSVAMFNTTNAVLGLVVMGVLMIAASLIIIFVPERNQEVLHEEAMV